ncbi:MAG TPA: DinB family protein [Planctomycetota bacterium]|nr:DinB family protein [Planctomycetota bacterium]
MTAGEPGPVIPDRYLAALDGRDPFDSLRKTPKRIKKLLKGASEKRLARTPPSGGWSVKQILAHLADGEVMIGSRYRMVVAMDRPALVGYDQDAFVERLGAEKLDSKTLLADFAHARAANLRLLERQPDEAFARVGLHSERGEESLARMLVMYAGHDLIHEAQIERVLLEKRPRKPKGPKASKPVKVPKAPKGKSKKSAAAPAGATT